MIGNSDSTGWVKSVQCMESVEVDWSAQSWASEQSSVAWNEEGSK